MCCPCGLMIILIISLSPFRVMRKQFFVTAHFDVTAYQCVTVFDFSGVLI